MTYPVGRELWWRCHRCGVETPPEWPARILANRDRVCEDCLGKIESEQWIERAQKAMETQ